MKRINFLLLAGFLLCLPTYAGAEMMGVGSLTMSASDPTQQMIFPDSQGNYYADYDGEYSLDGTTWKSEMFCVETAPGYIGTSEYSFFTVDDSLNAYGLDANKYIQATWLANLYTENETEDNKAATQVAIWELLFETDSELTVESGASQAIGGYALAAEELLDDLALAIANGADIGAYADNWLLAVSPAISENGTIEWSPYQNYLVSNPAPVPEPSTLLLLGIGLVGFGIVRKRMKKN
jgi:PEP-CTERM motif/Thioester domain